MPAVCSSRVHRVSRHTCLWRDAPVYREKCPVVGEPVPQSSVEYRGIDDPSMWRRGAASSRCRQEDVEHGNPPLLINDALFHSGLLSRSAPALQGRGSRIRRRFVVLATVISHSLSPLWSKSVYLPVLVPSIIEIVHSP